MASKTDHYSWHSQRVINSALSFIFILFSFCVTLLHGIFVPARFGFNITQFAWRSRFQVSATERSKCSVVLLFRHNFMFLKTQKHSKHLGINTAMGRRRHEFKLLLKNKEIMPCHTRAKHVQYDHE